MALQYPLKDPYVLSVDEVIKMTDTDKSKGLSESEALKRAKLFGPNSYKSRQQKSLWFVLAQQFISPIVYLLIVGSAISIYFNDFLDAIAIAAVILINALIGFVMELQARSSMNALKKMDISFTKVIRNGELMNIPSEQLVPGDLLKLEAGDMVPADSRLMEVNQLQCDESSLSGESLPVLKQIEKIAGDTPVGDQHNMIFKGTSVINGNGIALVIAIGASTQLGTITSLVESSSETATPLYKKLNSLSRKLIGITLVMTAIYALTGIIQGEPPFLIIETSIALAVAAIPEGLPIVATVALSYGMLLMARRNAIVKKLSAVETLGSTGVILTDKTGTLTENKIYVDTLAFPKETIKVQIHKKALIIPKDEIIKSRENLEKLLLSGYLCNNAVALPPTPDDATGTYSGDPVEIALLKLADNSGFENKSLYTGYRRIAEVPFSSDIMMMGTMHQTSMGYFIAAKGSVEHLMQVCSRVQYGPLVDDLNEDIRCGILAKSEKMAENGLRVLAFAYKAASIKDDKNSFLNDLIYVGMAGFLDPPRIDIKEAIFACRNAGIKVVMITGDHPHTAINIARKVGLIDENDKNVITGKELPPMEGITDEWTQRVLSTAVFARTNPQQKLEIAAIFQKAGNIVAMTGDGINDAPALKKADVGIAMGLRGTQVAKETASIVLKDDSFTSIAAAVSHGREIFQNIQKFVIYLVSCNLSEIFIVAILGVITPGATLLPLQILFLNMVTDIFPALALGLGAGDRTVMHKSPRDPKKGIISNKGWLVIMLYAAVMAFSVVVAVIFCRYLISDDNKVINNVAFITLTFGQLFHVFNMSSFGSGLFINEITTNKFIWFAFLICTVIIALVFNVEEMRLVLGLFILPFKIWLISLTASLLPLVAVQAYRAGIRQKQALI